LLKLWKGFPDFIEINGAQTIEEVPILRHYANSVWFNLKKDFFRKRQRKKVKKLAYVGFRELEEVVEPKDFTEDVENRELLGTLDNALAQLGDREGQVFRLRYIEYLDNATIARKLGITSNNVRSALCNAIRNLREIYEVAA
jgi:RNA polymerase sigma factor (sigma-70 family)